MAHPLSVLRQVSAIFRSNVPKSRAEFHTSRVQHATPLFAIAARANARETLHFSKASGLSVVNHSPMLESIRSSEVEPFKKSSGSATKVKTAAATSPRPYEHEWWKHESARSPKVSNTDSANSAGSSSVSDSALLQDLSKKLDKQEALVEEIISRIYKIESGVYNADVEKYTRSSERASSTVTLGLITLSLVSTVCLFAWADKYLDGTLTLTAKERRAREQAKQNYLDGLATLTAEERQGREGAEKLATSVKNLDTATESIKAKLLQSTFVPGVTKDVAKTTPKATESRVDVQIPQPQSWSAWTRSFFWAS